MKKTIMILTILFLFPLTLLAEDEKVQISIDEKITINTDQAVTDSTEPSVSNLDDVDIYKIPPILDPEYRHKKRHQFELVPYGGSYLGNSVGQTWVVGGKLYYYLNNTVGFGVNYGYSKLLTNDSSPLGRVLTNYHMHALDAEVILSNDAAFRAFDKMVEMDFYATLGVGTMWINDEIEPMGQIGGGVKFYTGLPWLAFRIDLNSYTHNTQQDGKNSIDFDMVITGGLSFFFPSHPSAYEKK